MTGYTNNAKKALAMAGDIALSYNHRYVGSEHILLALMKIPGVAKDVLLNFVKIDDYENILSDLSINEDDLIYSEAAVNMSERALRILEQSKDEAARHGNDEIGTSHILLSLLREKDCVADRILNTLKLNLADIYVATLQACGYSGADIKKEMNNLKKHVSGNSAFLDQYTKDLTSIAKQKKLDPCIGREKEMTRIIQVLCRKNKNNPCLIGEPGVGKTAVVEGLADLIARDAVPDIMKGMRILTLDLSGMVAGSKYRGEFEERIKKLINEVKECGNIILFLDEIHTIIGAGGAEGSMDAANILKPSLSRGEIKIIGATTREEYRKHIEKDSALERRFQPIVIEEPDTEDTINILKGLRSYFEKYHNTVISDEVIEDCVYLSGRYVNDRFHPDKAIDLLDEACSMAKLSGFKINKELLEYENRLIEIKHLKDKCLEELNIPMMHELNEEEDRINSKLLRVKSSKSRKPVKVSREDVAKIVSNWTKIPVTKLTQSENDKLLNLEKTLSKRVIGQEEAVSVVSKAIRRGRTGIKDPRKPIGTFLFLGPTGVGKTELCKALAVALFGKESAIIRVDMSEYMEKHSVSKMIGSPPGYVGFDDGGQLSERVRRNPYSIVLFDEIEKAHPDVFNILLQILDEGHVTDSQGRKVDFKNTIIIMTSNAGASSIISPKRLGFSKETDSAADYELMKNGVMNEIKNIFKPEFLNRIDDIVVFKRITEKEVAEIVKIMLNELSARIKNSLNLKLHVSKQVVDYIAKKGYEPKYGARPLKRAIQDNIEDIISDEVLKGSFAGREDIYLKLKDDKVYIQL
ncbi:MAG: ATP-dependent Clp protease ATP-binding subunit [Clostridiales bacterium]|nr:ATP-dependent Clp protease ATP-binding subunit [Clostridiales bacterium]